MSLSHLSNLALVVILVCLSISKSFAFQPSLRVVHKCQNAAFCSRVPSSGPMISLRNSRIQPKMTVQSAFLELNSAGMLLAEEIFGQVAAGGIAIILAGFMGAVFIGFTVDVDQLEKDFQADSEAGLKQMQSSASEPSEPNTDE